MAAGAFCVAIAFILCYLVNFSRSEKWYANLRKSSHISKCLGRKNEIRNKK
jgi:hypothetical protein